MDYTVVEDADLRPGTTGTKSIKQTRNSSDFTYRYWLFTNPIQPVAAATNVSLSLYMKQATATTHYRCYIFDSTDGITWAMNAVYGNPVGNVTGTTWGQVTRVIGGMDVAGTR